MSAAPNLENNLPAAKRRLDNAISALIDPKPVVLDRDDGTKPITWLDPLLDQLLDAVSGQTGERSGGASTIPVWADILDEVNKISSKVAEWQPEWPMPDVSQDQPTPTVIARLQALGDRKWSVEDAPLVDSIAVQLEKFAVTIREKLTPEPVIYLMAPAPQTGAAACTACGTDYVWRKDAGDNDRRKRQPALRVTKDGCRCQNPQCGASWEPGQLRMLAAALGYPLPSGVLE